MRKCRENPPSGAFSRLEFVGRSRALLLALALALAAALTLSACGSDDGAELLPGTTAAAITENLESVEQLAAEGDCTGATDAAEEVSLQVDELTGVDKELKQALEKGATRLNEVVDECDEAPEEDEEETISTEAEEPSADEQKEEEREQKAQEKADKEAEKEQQKEEKEQEKESPPPVEPPEKEEKTPPENEEDGGTPSGGVSPGVSAEGGE